MSKVIQYATIDDKVFKDLGNSSNQIYSIIASSLHHMAQKVWYIDNHGIGIANIHRLCLSILKLIIFFHFHCEL